MGTEIRELDPSLPHENSQFTVYTITSIKNNVKPQIRVSFLAYQFRMDFGYNMSFAASYRVFKN